MGKANWHFLRITLSLSLSPPCLSLSLSSLEAQFSYRSSTKTNHHDLIKQNKIKNELTNTVAMNYWKQTCKTAKQIGRDRKPSGSRVWKKGSMSLGSAANDVEIFALTAAIRFLQSAGILFRSTSHSVNSTK